jgi:hypothetical protein
MDDVSVDRRTRADRPLALCGERNKRSRRAYSEEVRAVREEEDRLGRSMTPTERDAFAQGFHGPEHAAEARLLAAEAPLLRAR